MTTRSAIARSAPARFRHAGGRIVTLLTLVAATALTGCATGGPTATDTATGPGSATARPSGSTPARPAGAPDHVVVAIFENKSSSQVDGAAQASYLNSMITRSALFSDAQAVAHPSQPNYLALFSGSTQDVFSDQCPLNLGDRPNLGRQLLDSGRTFIGYSEGLPAAGYTGCRSGDYAAKHSPWTHFGNVPASVNQPLTAMPTDFSRLPTVSFVVPDMCSDMHDCPVSRGDSWARDHLDRYAAWAATHNSLLIITFDEDDNSRGNRIVTMVSGAGVRPGRYPGPVTHYTVLGLIEDLYGLPRLGAAATAAPLPDIWD